MKDVSDVCRALGREHAAQALTHLARPVKLNGVNEQHRSGEESNPLPPIKSAQELSQILHSVPVEVVHGLLHKGSKMLLGGGSKCYKTFCLADLALSVACGLDWWGMETTIGKVLYVNFEIQEGFFQDRLNAIATAKSVCLDTTENLDVWTLRGYCADLSVMMPRIIEQTKTRSYDLIILDPIYKGMGARDENSAGDINSMLNEIEKLAVKTGAAVVFGAHFSKGNQAGKESIDRISGSGVFARDPDSIVVMTRHENEDTYTIEATLRNFKPIEPFCLRWEWPLMVRDDEADPGKLKRSGGKTAKYTASQLVDALGYGAHTYTEWKEKTCGATGMSSRTFADKKKELMAEEPRRVIEVEPNKWAASQHLAMIRKENNKAEKADAMVQPVQNASIAPCNGA